MALIRTSEQYVGVAGETTWGVGVVPTRYIPHTSFNSNPMIGEVVDDGRRGTIAKDHAVYRTTEHTEVELEMRAHPDVLGHLFLPFLGDVVTTGTSPNFLHTFKTGLQNRHLTFHWYDGHTEFQYAGGVLSEMTISSAADAEVTVSVSGKTKIGTTVAKTTPTFSTTKSLVGTFATLEVDTVLNKHLSGFELTIARESDFIFGGNNSPDPTNFFLGTVEVTGSLTLNVEDQAERNYFLNKEIKNFVIKLRDTAGVTTPLVITMPKVSLSTLSNDSGDQNLRLDLEFRAIYDATISGPIKVELTSSVATYI